MMAVRRPPKDTTPVLELEPRSYWYRNNGVVQTEGSNDLPKTRDERPGYAYGARITLPGGTVIKRSTNYTHQSAVFVAKPARVNTTWGTGGRNNATAEDWGQEYGFLSTLTSRNLMGITPYGHAREEAVTKCLNKIADQKINLGENLATLGQTVRMFTSKGSAMLALLRLIQRDRSVRHLWGYPVSEIRKRGILGTSADKYLEYIYGLKPLMDDVYTTYTEMQSASRKSLLLRAVGTADRTEERGPDARWTNLSRSRYFLYRQSATQKVKCTLWARPDPNHSGLRSLNEYGLSNPLGLGWDLLPYSFVVDWFLPIGPVLYALTAPLGLVFVDGSISTRTSESIDWTFDIRWNVYNSTGENVRSVNSYNYGNLHKDYEGFGRTVMSNWPRPGLWVAPDPFKADRPLKALALAVSRFAGDYRRTPR